MSFPCLETSAGSPSPILGSSPVSWPWHLWFLCNHAFPAHLDHFSLFCVSLGPLNTWILILFYYFCSRVCLPCLSPPCLPWAVLFSPSRLSTHVISSEPPSPVELICSPTAFSVPLIPSYFNSLLRRSVFSLKLMSSWRAAPTSCPSLFSQLCSPLPDTGWMLSDHQN